MSELESTDLINLLNKAIARELQVSIQYMFQHSRGNAYEFDVQGKSSAAKRRKFVASHAPYWLPGVQTLKRIAITEMRHAESIAARVVALGGTPTTQPDPITLGDSISQMLELDKDLEQGAIKLYGQIIAAAREQSDGATVSLFERILIDEKKHHAVFEGMLGK
jgi:bacterioferritin